MPQMSPMNWLLLFFFMIMMTYMYMSILYFSTFYPPQIISHSDLKIKKIKKLIKF